MTRHRMSIAWGEETCVNHHAEPHNIFHFKDLGTPVRHEVTA